MLANVELIELARHEDDRGYLYEVIHDTDPFLTKFGQTYMVGSPMPGTIRAFHAHRALWDYFCIIEGAAKFVLSQADEDEVATAFRDGRVLPSTATSSYVLTARKPSLLIVPPGTWHGWMSLEPNTILLSTGSEVYDSKNPDEIRVGPNVFGDVWSVKGR